MKTYDFQQVDVFAPEPLTGNPVAVVLGADGLSDATMAAIANWTNLSETTFVLPPTRPDADYRVRIFTPLRELPFAGHPTLGTCHAWLGAGGVPRGDEIIQECAVGPVRIRRHEGRLAFAAPPLLRSGPVDAALVARVADVFGIDPGRVVRSQWVDNGPGWTAIMLGSRAEVLALKPDLGRLGELCIGVVGPWREEDGPDAAFEVRAFAPSFKEDPVTGSLNAGLAQWLIGAGLAPPAYVASQGTALGRRGRVHVTQSGPDIWIGGETITCVAGRLTL